MCVCVCVCMCVCVRACVFVCVRVYIVVSMDFIFQLPHIYTECVRILHQLSLSPLRGHRH